MDVLTVLLLTVVLILVILDKISVSDKLHNLEHRFIELQNLLKRQEQPIKPVETAKPEVKPAVPPSVAAPVPEPPIPGEVKLPERPKPVNLPPETVVERQREVIRETTPLTSRPVKAWEPPVRRPVEPQPSFFERYPDLEKFIGENLVNKIGIAILVLAIGFFVKYAIDQHWIGPVGRVGIGIFCGAILVGFAHRLRKNYKAFSSVLAGGGIAVFYFSITLAFQQFHLFSQLAALCIMVVITIFAVALSLLYDKQELAVIALIGGFASPFLLSTGTANYNGLFIYLLVLNTGLLIIAYYKAWRILNISSFALSVIVVAMLIYSLNSNYYVGLRYATIFYLLFFTINIINNIRENKAFIAIDFTILLVNTALYFAAGMYLLTGMGATEYRGLFCAALGFINLVLSYVLFRKKTVDANILYLLIGITLTFISLTAPIQLHGNNITQFWTCETVLLYWLYQKSGVRLMKLTSLILWLLMIISLCMDIENIYVYKNAALAIIANKGFITTVFSAMGCYGLYLLVKRDRNAENDGISINAAFFRVMALVLLFLAGGLEINHQFAYYYPTTCLNVLYLMLYAPVFTGMFHFISTRRNRESGWLLSLNQVLLACTIALYLALSGAWFEQLDQLLTTRSVSVSHFAVHWISDTVIVILFYQLISLCRKRLNDAQQTTANWLISAAVVLFFSLELCLVYEAVFYSKVSPIDHLQTVYIKAVLPILWGVASFALMWLGMRNKQRNLRVISLTLFTITLVKLFLFDIVDIPVGGKIAAFFCLGVLLLIVSFMYQKVKKIITDDGEKAKNE